MLPNTLLLFLLVKTACSFVLPGGYGQIDDMVLANIDIQTIKEGGDVDARFKDRSTGANGNENLNVGAAAVAMDRNRWPNGEVAYVLDKKVVQSFWGIGNWFGRKSNTHKAILKGMREWEQKTCIRFVKRTYQKDYIRFINGGFGKCWSHVGRIGGEQQLSIGKGCRSKGVVLHEIGHALGLHHEQSRPDRDNYVDIKWDEVTKGMEVNFKKYTFSQVNTKNSPYDYGSIMHYAKDSFGKKPWSTTIVPKQRGVSIGQRIALSNQDALQINRWYGCTGGLLPPRK